MLGATRSHPGVALPSAGPRGMVVSNIRPHDMPALRHTREAVVERLMAVIRREGYDGASLAQLSKATGLGKGSLYHHFPSGK